MQAQIRPYTYLSKDDIDHLLSISLKELKQIRDDARLSARRENIPFLEIENERLFKFDTEQLGMYFRRGSKLIHTNGEKETEIPENEIPKTLTISTIYYVLETERSIEIDKLRASRIMQVKGGSVYCNHEFDDGVCAYCNATREF